MDYLSPSAGAVTILVQLFEQTAGSYLGDHLNLLKNPQVASSEIWWNSLEASLYSLGGAITARRPLAEDYYRRVLETFMPTSELNQPLVHHWSVAHGDLHWGNVTGDAELVDWDTWGLWPFGRDAATLLIYSLNSTDVVGRIEDWIRHLEHLQRHDALVSIVFACVEFLRIAETSKIYPDAYVLRVRTKMDYALRALTNR